MVFSGIPFLFRFMPVFFLVYYGASGNGKAHSQRMRNLILFFGSLIFYAWGEPVYIVLMLFSTFSDYMHGMIIAKMQEEGKETGAKAALASSLIINISLLGFFKYGGIFPLPLGISFYTFQTMAYSIDVYRREIKPQRNFLKFGVYVSMFPQLIAGPIVRYTQIVKELDCRQTTADFAAYGIRRFVLGLGKKVLLANQAGIVWEQISLIPAETLSLPEAWLGMLVFAFQIYFDFSGYSDMAIGLGAMLGFSFPENFRYPYLATSVTEFWRRWHMTLSGWFRDYVYIPLGGSRKGLLRQLVNILIVWSLTGIWHGSVTGGGNAAAQGGFAHSLGGGHLEAILRQGGNFLIWGLWFAGFLILEKVFMAAYKRWAAAHGNAAPEQPVLKQGESKKYHIKYHIRKNYVRKCVGFIYTTIIVLTSWAFFSHNSMAEAFSYVKAMFYPTTAGNRAPETFLFLLYNYRVLFLVWMLGVTPLPAKAAVGLRHFLEKRQMNGLWAAFELIFLIGVFLLSVAFVVDASYNPFLYFRF